MGNLKIGDIVARKSYGMDMFFKVVDIKRSGNENIAILKGICYRIQADSPESDLILQTEQGVEEHNSKMRSAIDKKSRDILVTHGVENQKKVRYRNTPKENSKKFSFPGKVPHIDGDNEYLETCSRRV